MKRIITTLTVVTFALGLAAAAPAQTVTTPEKGAVQTEKPAVQAPASKDAAKPGEVAKPAAKEETKPGATVKPATQETGKTGPKELTKKGAKKEAKKEAKKVEKKSVTPVAKPKEEKQ